MDAIMNSKLLGLLLRVVALELIKPEHHIIVVGFVSVNSIFMIVVGFRENRHHFFSSIKNTLILTL